MAARLSNLTYFPKEIAAHWEDSGEDAYRGGHMLRSFNLKENVHALGIQAGETAWGVFEECGGDIGAPQNTLWLAYRGSDPTNAKSDVPADAFALPVEMGKNSFRSRQPQRIAFGCTGVHL